MKVFLFVGLFEKRIPNGMILSKDELIPFFKEEKIMYQNKFLKCTKKKFFEIAVEILQEPK